MASNCSYAKSCPIFATSTQTDVQTCKIYTLPSFQACPDGQALFTSFQHGYWECRDYEFPSVSVTDDDGRIIILVPKCGYDVCPSDNVASTVAPPDEITSNPMGTCRCDGEIWLSEGCSYAFSCDSSMENGGEYIACPEVSHN